jgi:Lar family restriction alleviation protein
MTDKLSEAVELLPCPFCGHPESVSLDRCLSRLAYVECLGCSAHGPAKDHERGAIAEWNTRSSLKGDEEMVLRVAKALHAHEWAGQPKPDNFSVDREYWVAAARAAITAIGEVR